MAERSVLTALCNAALGLMLGCVLSAPVTAEPHAAEARAHHMMQAERPDWAAVHAAFAEAAEDGSASAMSYLGWMHEKGLGTDVDMPQAAHWYAQAADGGAFDYAVKLGWMHLSGEGMPVDRQQAENWFRRAIDGGHRPANIAFASVLIADALGGRNIERVGEARILLEQALEADLRMAAFFLARLYIEGIGGHPTDAAKAAHYTRIGAEDGNAQMQAWYALMHARGDGVELDRAEAAFWAGLAAAGGDPIGQQLHAALQAELSEAEREAAVRRTVEWLQHVGAG